MLNIDLVYNLYDGLTPDKKDFLVCYSKKAARLWHISSALRILAFQSLKFLRTFTDAA